MLTVDARPQQVHFCFFIIVMGGTGGGNLMFYIVIGLIARFWQKCSGGLGVLNRSYG